jgi:hypothetical protein
MFEGYLNGSQNRYARIFGIGVCNIKINIATYTYDMYLSLDWDTHMERIPV